MNLYKKLIQQTAIYGLSTILGRLLNYLLIPIYTAYFLPEEYGKVAYLYSFAALFSVFLTHGMETTFFKFINQEKDKNSVISNAFISVALASFLFLILGFAFGGNISNYENFGFYIKLFVIFLSLDALSSIPFAKLRHENKALKYSTIKLINIFITIGLNLFFIVALPKLIQNESFSFLREYFPDLGIGYIFISNLVASSVMFLVLSKEILKIRLTINKTLLIKMLSYSWPLLVAGLAAIINETMDRVLLEWLLPKDISMHNIGIYSAVYKLSIFMALFTQSYRMGVEPFFFAHQKEKNSEKTYANMMLIFVIVMSGIFLLLMANINILKHFLRNKIYWEGLFIAPILFLSQLFLGIYINLSIWYKLSGKTIYGAYISIIGAVITIAINILLIPKIGYEASAWATFSAYGIMMIISYLWGKKHYNIPYNTLKMLSYISTSTILSLLCFYVFDKNIVIGNVFFIIFIASAFFIEKKKINA